MNTERNMKMKLSEQKNNLKVILPTGIPPLDDILGGGLHSGYLNVIAGRAATRKTSLALYMAGNMAKSGKRILFLSLEMSEKMARNKTALLCGDPFKENIIIDDSVFTGTAHICDVINRTGKIDALFIDYLQLCADLNQYHEIMHALKDIAVSKNIPVILTSTLSREEHADDPHLMLSKLSYYNNAIQQHADVVIFLSRMPYWEIEDDCLGNDDIIMMNVAKNGNGNNGAVAVRWNEEKMSFSYLINHVI